MRYVYPDPKECRTWTKEEWEYNNRMSRIMNRILVQREEEMREEIEKRATNLLLYGTTHPEAWMYYP